jgi:hypothetical protein
VRQLSIALITFNWPRLTWLRLASRHAGPWPRKMSATSSDGRAMAGGRLRQGKMVERTRDGSQQIGGDLRIAGSGIELRMSEKNYGVTY